MPKGNRKGSAFEREICKQLSLWWTYGIDDDVFWRTAGSGARAKVRSKKGKQTFGQAADIQATDPIGQPLMDLCSIELKRGYPTETFANIVESSRTANAKPCIFQQFIKQAKTDHKNAKTRYWMLISKRNMREAIITIPICLYRDLKEISSMSIRYCCPSSILSGDKGKYFITTLDRFLQYISPKSFKIILEEFGND